MKIHHVDFCDEISLAVSREWNIFFLKGYFCPFKRGVAFFAVENVKIKEAGQQYLQDKPFIQVIISLI